MYPDIAAVKSAARAAIVEIQRQGYSLSDEQARLLEGEVEEALRVAFASHMAREAIELELAAPLKSVESAIDRAITHYLSFEYYAG